MSNTDETYKNSELCQKCANCCKTMWFWTHEFDDFLRYNWLATDLVTVEAINDDTWRVILHIPCQHLVETEPGTWSCGVYDRVRPSYCRTYPNNFLTDYMREKYPEFLHQQAETFCPALKQLMQQEEEVPSQ